MSDDNDNLDDFEPDQQKRIEKLKRKANEITGGEMKSFAAEDIDPNLSEEFWQQVVEYESAPFTTSFKQLEAAGIILPPPGDMDDAELSQKLWVVIETLTKMGTFIYGTNHLSDRELYEDLWKDVLHEEKPDIKYSPCGAWNIDMVGSGSEEDTYLWMKYYADEETRQRWLVGWPDYEMPQHEDPPYDRDRLIAQTAQAMAEDDDLTDGSYDFDDGEIPF